MAKTKSRAQIMIADGRGGMMEVKDRRFEKADWPVTFEVEKDDADDWFRYFSAECERRNWNWSGTSQLEPRENSGTITVNPGVLDKPQLAVVWERERNGFLKVRSRSAGTIQFSHVEMEKLFQQVTEQCKARITELIYCRGQLCYDGLPWRGELWLEDSLRLGPPSLQYEKALFGPRIIIVDEKVECVGKSDVPWAFRRNLEQLGVFLSVVMGQVVHLPAQGQAWIFRFSETGATTDCSVEHLGYVEKDNPEAIPISGTIRAVPLFSVVRPDFEQRGITFDMNEQTLPEDIADLWSKYKKLTPERRLNFLQAAAKWQEALLHWSSRRSTLSLALMVVACEALKPSGFQFKDHDGYDVVKALLGDAVVKRLQNLFDPAVHPGTHPQSIRNAHLHRGEFRASEFTHAMMTASYQDPSFDQAARELASVTKAVLIEWLKQGGKFTMPPVKESKSTFQRWVKKWTFILLPILTICGLAAGAVLGWFLRSFWGNR